MGKKNEREKTTVTGRRIFSQICEVRISEKRKLQKNDIELGEYYFYLFFGTGVPQNYRPIFRPPTPRRILDKNWQGVPQNYSISEVRIKSKFVIF